MYSKKLNSEKETIQFAKALASHLKENMTLLLEGNLGAGKTTFAKGIAEGLGINRIIKSPTYTLIREYNDGKLPMYHMDLYRLENQGAEELGLDEYFENGGVCLVEWASFAKEDMPEEYLIIHLDRVGREENVRKITLEPRGSEYDRLVEEVENG